MELGGTDREIVLWQLLEWTHIGTGDWSTNSNWTPRLGAPPGAVDEAIFGSLASSYTVTVTTTVVDVAIGIIPTDASAPTFLISGALTTSELIYVSLSSPTSMTVEAGGLLDVTSSLAWISQTWEVHRG